MTREASAPAAQARVWLELADHGDEVVEADDSLELEARTVLGGPNAIGLDPADHGQADDHAVAAAQLGHVLVRPGVDHEAVCREVADMKLEVAAGAMLADHRKIDRVTRRAAHVGYGKLSAACHETPT